MHFFPFIISHVVQIDVSHFHYLNCGILPKKCHVAPSSLAMQTAPLATRGIAHSTRGEFCTADVPPFHDISQLAPAPGWKRSAIQLPRSDMSGSFDSAYP